MDLRDQRGVIVSTKLNPKYIKGAIALMLTFVSGYVDIVGFVAAYHLFSANMTGNTVHLGQDLVMHAWWESLLAFSVVAAFVGGSIAGRAMMEVAARLRWRTVATVNLALETSLILAFALSAGNIPAASGKAALSGNSWLLLMLAAAMGLQTATITRIGSLTIHTTFVTGMLNKFSQQVSHLLFDLYDVGPGNEHKSQMKGEVGQMLFVGSIWVLYLMGATAGTAAHLRWGNPALYLPVGLLLISILVDQTRPLSMEEEKDQFER